MAAILTKGDGPFWLNILVAAEAWGCPPWEIAPNSGSKLVWLIRWQEYMKILNVKIRTDSKAE